MAADRRAAASRFCALLAAEERFEVAHRAEVGQLVGVDDRVDARDLAPGDVERHDADQALLRVEEERSRVAVDFDGAYGDAGNARGPAEPVDDRARDAVASVQRPGERRSL